MMKARKHIASNIEPRRVPLGHRDNTDCQALVGLGDDFSELTNLLSSEHKAML